MSVDIEDEMIFEEVSDYYKEHHIREMFKDYLKKLMLHKPDDPIAFLMKQIKTEPYIHPPAPSTSVRNIIYFQRLDYRNPKLFSVMISKMDRYKGCDIWLDLMSSDEVTGIRNFIDNYAAASMTIQNFLTRYQFPQEILDSIFVFFQKAAANKITIYALDENNISLSPYNAENKTPIEKVKSIMERVSDQSTSKWVQKVYTKGGLRDRPQLILAGVEHIPHLHNAMLGFVSESLDKLRVSYGPTIDMYMTVVESVRSDLQQSGAQPSEADEAFVEEAVQYLRKMRDFGCPPAVTL